LSDYHNRMKRAASWSSAVPVASKNLTNLERCNGFYFALFRWIR